MSKQPWGLTTDSLKTGELVRMPDQRVFVVGFVNGSRARVFPLTPVERQITVHARGKSEHTTKDIYGTGSPMDISPNSGLPRVEVSDLTDAEFIRLTRYIENGGEFPPSNGGRNE